MILKKNQKTHKKFSKRKSNKFLKSKIKSKIKNFSSSSKVLSRKTFNSLEYPYYKNYITKTSLLNDFSLLKQYQPIFLKYNPLNNKKNLNKFQNRLIIFKENYYKNKDLYNITEYFSQFCRVKCLNNLKETDTPYDYFFKNKEDIYNKLIKIKEKQKKENNSTSKINYLDLNEYLYENVKQCTNFNTTVMISILKFLKPKRMLDPSAGWGDRLIAAIAYGCSYTGIDPSNCMNKYYYEIINELVPRNKKNEYQIIQDGFENVIIEEDWYDLVFTSPPFFDFELYEINKSQSVEKFNTLEKWLNGFLFPLIEKSYKALIKNGYFGIYISDYTGVSFTKEMFKYINNSVKGFKYQGDIHFWDETNKKTVRTIFFFRKIF